jgi:hypothetical protein
MFTVILSDESVNFFTFSLIYLCKSESQKVFAQFTDACKLSCYRVVTERRATTCECDDENKNRSGPVFIFGGGTRKLSHFFAL